MAMPGKPARPQGAEGQIDVPAPFEAHEAPDAGIEQGDDRVAAPVGATEQGPNSPTHGAAGGLDVDFASVAPVRFHSDSTSTGMTSGHPAFGGALAADLGEK